MTTAIIADKDTAKATGVLHMVRADIDALQFRRWMGSRQLVDDDHAMHCLLTECFGKDRNIRPQPFRLIIPRAGRGGTLYGYSRADADELRDTANLFACPLQEKALPLASLDSKRMPSTWQVGRRLGFEVRIRPVVRRYKAPRNIERDAFLNEAIKHSDRHGMERAGRSREKVYREWLQKRFEQKGGAALNVGSAKLVSFRQTRAIRNLHQRHSEGPDVLMRGEVEITDEAKFGDMLANGIGRHKAYGYGMLLLRPA